MKHIAALLLLALTPLVAAQNGQMATTTGYQFYSRVDVDTLNNEASEGNYESIDGVVFTPCSNTEESGTDGAMELNSENSYPCALTTFIDNCSVGYLPSGCPNAAYQLLYWDTPGISANQCSEVQVVTLSSSTDDLAIGVRDQPGSPTPTSGYGVAIYGPAGSSATGQLIKDVAGTISTLTDVVTITVADGDYLMLCVNGEVLQYYRNWVPNASLTATDSSIATGTPWFGVSFSGESGNVGDVQFNRFMGYSIL